MMLKNFSEACMYHDYFGLQEAAFSIAVNPKFLFMSQQHKEALAHLLYGVQEGGFVLLSGEVGTGKTTIIRCLLEQIPQDTDIAYVLNPMADVPSLLATICDELRIELPKKAGVKGMMDALQKHLLDNHCKGVRTVLLIDEAQLLSVEVLEQIRLLTNLETATQKLLQIVLVGQPEINELLGQARLRQLSQRITARFHLQALNLDETTQYIQHRLKIAGSKENREIFPASIIRRIHRFSKGTPRLINIICERALIGAYGQNKDSIDKSILNMALSEVQDTATHHPKTNQFRYWAGVFVISFLLIVIGTFFWQRQASDKTTVTPTNIAEKVAIPATTNPVISNPYLLTQNVAFQLLFEYQDITVSSESHPCWQTEAALFSCDKQAFSTWEAFTELNRPGILTLVSDDKSLASLIVIGESTETLIALNENAERVTLDKTTILPKWNGQASYLWRKPERFSGPISKGSSSPLIADIANKFALLDGRENPLSDGKFNALLETRVKLFQERHRLVSDGILGQRTLMKLNEELGLVKSLVYINDNAGAE